MPINTMASCGVVQVASDKENWWSVTDSSRTCVFTQSGAIACLQKQEGLQRLTVHVCHQGFTAHMLSPFKFDTVEFLVYNWTAAQRVEVPSFASKYSFIIPSHNQYGSAWSPAQNKSLAARQQRWSKLASEITRTTEFVHSVSQISSTGCLNRVIRL